MRITLHQTCIRGDTSAISRFVTYRTNTNVTMETYLKHSRCQNSNRSYIAEISICHVYATLPTKCSRTTLISTYIRICYCDQGFDFLISLLLIIIRYSYGQTFLLVKRDDAGEHFCCHGGGVKKFKAADRNDVRKISTTTVKLIMPKKKGHSEYAVFCVFVTPKTK